jgi:hypothetical protein
VFFIGFALDMAFGIFNGFLLDPPLAVPALVWAAVLVGSGLATWRSVRQAPVFTVDPAREVFQFLRGSSVAYEIPLAALSDISIIDQADRHRNSKAPRHRVELARGGGRAALVLAEYDHVRDAEALADWLRQQAIH